MSLKAAVIAEDQVRISGPFLPPFSSLVSGRSILAAAGMKTLVEVDSSEEALKFIDSTRLWELLDGGQLVWKRSYVAGGDLQAQELYLLTEELELRLVQHQYILL